METDGTLHRCRHRGQSRLASTACWDSVYPTMEAETFAESTIFTKVPRCSTRRHEMSNHQLFGDHKKKHLVPHSESTKASYLHFDVMANTRGYATIPRGLGKQSLPQRRAALWMAIPTTVPLREAGTLREAGVATALRRAKPSTRGLHATCFRTFRRLGDYSARWSRSVPDR